VTRNTLAAVLSGALCLVQAGGQQRTLTPSASCSQMSAFDRSIATLPRGVQRNIREVLRPAINSIIHDPGMGIDDVTWRNAKLYVVRLNRDTAGYGLYAVSWEHPQFVVNSAIWIVEVKRNRTRNIGPPVSKTAGPFAGFGYPGLMFAAKGYRKSGGPEGESVCARKLGATYNFVACPANCG